MDVVMLKRWAGQFEVSEALLHDQPAETRNLIRQRAQATADRAAEEVGMVAGSVQWRFLSDLEMLAYGAIEGRVGYKVVAFDAYLAPREGGMTRDVVDRRQGYLLLVPARGH